MGTPLADLPRNLRPCPVHRADANSGNPAKTEFTEDQRRVPSRLRGHDVLEPYALQPQRRSRIRDAASAKHETRLSRRSPSGTPSHAVPWERRTWPGCVWLSPSSASRVGPKIVRSSAVERHDSLGHEVNRTLWKEQWKRLEAVRWRSEEPFELFVTLFDDLAEQGVHQRSLRPFSCWQKSASRSSQSAQPHRHHVRYAVLTSCRRLLSSAGKRCFQEN